MDLSPHTRLLWSALPAEPSEIVHSFGEGGDRRGSGHALGGPQEVMSSQPETREVARTLGVTAHAGRTESRTRRSGVRLRHLHRGGARGRLAEERGDPQKPGTDDRGQVRRRPGLNGGGREKKQRGQSEGGEGCREGRVEGPGNQPPVREASSSSCHLHLLIYSKNNSGRAAGRHQWGRGLEEGGTEGGAREGKGAEAGSAQFSALVGAKKLGFLLRPTPSHPTS